MHVDFFHRHFELFRGDLRKNRVAALADFHRAREHGDFAFGIDVTPAAEVVGERVGFWMQAKPLPILTPGFVCCAVCPNRWLPWL